MPINVAWQDERGKVLERWPGSIWGDLLQRAPASTVCLRFVDPYGDAVFNRYQVPVLVQELEELAGRVDGEDREAIQSLLGFLTAPRDWVHAYVRFIGD
ncbi:MAG: hypothetical protein KJZ87_09185 [Thermoguttaceae bacterium]|nr:hypothetical protein [Thermoguttaceae bacterium]